jgi:hypothetical protein
VVAVANAVINEPLGFVKGQEFLDYLSVLSILKKDSARWSQL